jgi:hypothetical protein
MYYKYVYIRMYYTYVCMYVCTYMYIHTYVSYVTEAPLAKASSRTKAWHTTN